MMIVNPTPAALTRTFASDGPRVGSATFPKVTGPPNLCRSIALISSSFEIANDDQLNATAQVTAEAQGSQRDIFVIQS
jgi:hypothetical protein